VSAVRETIKVAVEHVGPAIPGVRKYMGGLVHGLFIWIVYCYMYSLYTLYIYLYTATSLYICIRLTTKPLTVRAVDMQQGRDLMLVMCSGLEP
jgi:hypothetical protein